MSLKMDETNCVCLIGMTHVNRKDVTWRTKYLGHCQTGFRRGVEDWEWTFSKPPFTHSLCQYIGRKTHFIEPKRLQYERDFTFFVGQQ